MYLHYNSYLRFNDTQTTAKRQALGGHGGARLEVHPTNTIKLGNAYVGLISN